MLQCLLAVRQLLNSLEPYYILNNLYITEYCVWIQKARYVYVCVLQGVYNVMCSFFFFFYFHYLLSPPLLPLCSARQIQNIADELDEVFMTLELTGEKKHV